MRTLPRSSRALAVPALALVLLASPLRAADKDTTADFDKAVGTVTLTNGSGDGQVSVEVDGYGSFGSSVETSAGARYNPVGPLALGSTAFESALFFADMTDRAGFTEFRDFLTTDNFGADLPHVDVTLAGGQATSTFDVSRNPADNTRYQVSLTQRVETLAGNAGSRLVQTYTIQNLTGNTANLTLVRFFDGDLCFIADCENPSAPEWSNDLAGASEDFGTLYAFDSGDSVTEPVTAVAIQRSSSLVANGNTYSIQPFRTEDEFELRMTDRIDNNSQIPPGLHAKIYKDASPQDRLTDSAYDPTLSLQDTFTIPNGATLIYTTTTTWGEITISEVVPVIFRDGFDEGDTSAWCLNGVSCP